MNLLFLLRHHQRTGVGGRPGDRPAHRRADGPGRHLRPARRRLRPLRRGRHLDRAALREDALRQRAAAAGLHPAVAAHRRPVRPPDRRRDRRVPAARPGHPGRRPGVGAGRRHRRRRGPDLRVDAGAARPRCSGEEDGAWAADLFRVTDAGHVRARQQRAGAGPGHRRRRARRWSQRWRDVRARLLAARAHASAAGPRRQGGRLLERPGDHRAGRARAC